MRKIAEIKSLTVVISARNVYDLFHMVYAEASEKVISVHIDVANLTATIVYNMEDAG